MEPNLAGGNGAHHNGHGAAHDVIDAVANGVAVTTGEALAILDASPQQDSQEEPKAPAWSTRGEAPGLRGCWAVNKLGTACGAPRRGDGDYCSAHSGLGVSADPKGNSLKGAAKSAQNRRRRANLRLAIGVSRSNTPRGVLRAAAFLHSEELAARALDAALDPSVPSVQAGRMALELIREVDPPVQATITTPLPTDPDGVSKLSFSQLLSLGESMGIQPLPSPQTGS